MPQLCSVMVAKIVAALDVTRTFHTCAKIHPEPCGVLEYFMIIHKYENSTGSSPLKEFFPTVNLCMAVIKYSFKIFGHLFYYFYQLCSLCRLLFHLYPFLQFDAKFRSFGHLQDVPLAGRGSWKKWIHMTRNTVPSKEASSRGYLWGEQLEGKGYEKDYFLTTYPFPLNFVRCVLLLIQKCT